MSESELSAYITSSIRDGTGDSYGKGLDQDFGSSAESIITKGDGRTFRSDTVYARDGDSEDQSSSAIESTTWLVTEDEATSSITHLSSLEEISLPVSDQAFRNIGYEKDPSSQSSSYLSVDGEPMSRREVEGTRIRSESGSLNSFEMSQSE